MVEHPARTGQSIHFFVIFLLAYDKDFDSE